MTLLLSLLKREIKRASDPVVLDIPGHIEHSVANSSPLLHNFFKRSCVAQVQEHGDAEMGPTKSSHALEYYSRDGKMKDLKNMIIDY